MELTLPQRESCCVPELEDRWDASGAEIRHWLTAGALRFAVGPRNLLLEQPDEVREANINAIPDPIARAVRRSVLEHGVEAPEFAGALRKMIDFLDRADAALKSAEWLSGDAFGIADAAALPYVLRLDHLAMAPLLSRDARPALADWYQRVQARPTFATAVAAWAPDFAVDMLRSNGRAVWPQIQALGV
jgi:glutathione S-transferase